MSTPAPEALRRLLRPGDCLVWGQGAAEPLTATAALLDPAPLPDGLSVFSGIAVTDTLQQADRLRVRSYGAVGTLRALAEAGRLDIIPCHSGQVHRYITDGLIGCDVALVQVSPAPGGRGFSFGVTADFMPAAVAKARVVIAEVNAAAPSSFGDCRLDPARIDLLIESDRPLPELGPAAGGALEQLIAGHCQPYVEDGATLQIGLGALPDVIAATLRDRRDLGLHGPMLSDAAIGLIACGAVTNRRKPVDPGVSVTGLIVGSAASHALAHRNPAIAVRSSAAVSDERVLAAIPHFVSINSALEVDLTGAVNAETIGGRSVGAIGGQADFVRATQRSPGGRSIIALASTARGGKASRIVARLSGPTTTPRGDVDVFVTEHGAAELRARSLAERMRAMLRIADPAFQPALEREMHAMLRDG